MKLLPLLAVLLLVPHAMAEIIVTPAQPSAGVSAELNAGGNAVWDLDDGKAAKTGSTITYTWAYPGVYYVTAKLGNTTLTKRVAVGYPQAALAEGNASLAPDSADSDTEGGGGGHKIRGPQLMLVYFAIGGSFLGLLAIGRKVKAKRSMASREKSYEKEPEEAAVETPKDSLLSTDDDIAGADNPILDVDTGDAPVDALDDEEVIESDQGPVSEEEAQAISEAAGTARSFASPVGRAVPLDDLRDGDEADPTHKDDDHPVEPEAKRERADLGGATLAEGPLEDVDVNDAAKALR